MPAENDVTVAGGIAAPWYRQFWPWFLIALPTVAVVASFASLAVALRNADSLVRNDWSIAGDRINATLALEDEAVRRRITAEIRLDEPSRALHVRLAGGTLDDSAAVRLVLRHPADATRDVALTLAPRGNGLYTAAIDRELAGDWYATLSASDGTWIVTRRLTLESDGDAALLSSG
jgi:hypothetical protein